MARRTPEPKIVKRFKGVKVERDLDVEGKATFQDGTEGLPFSIVAQQQCEGDGEDEQHITNLVPAGYTIVYAHAIKRKTEEGATIELYNFYKMLSMDGWTKGESLVAEDGDWIPGVTDDDVILLNDPARGVTVSGELNEDEEVFDLLVVAIPTVSPP